MPAKRINIIALIIALWFFAPVELISQSASLYFDKNLYTEFNKTLPIQRDDFFELKLNSIIRCRGTVISIGTNGRYKKNFRLVMKDVEAEKVNINLSYYVFFDDKGIFSMIPKNGIFECTGQMMAYTPLNVKRDSYIVDVIMEKGSLVQE